MASMVVRNIPDDVYERLKQRAKSAGKSAEQLAREAIAEKARPSTDELLRRADEIRARSKPVDGFDIVAEIRADRDAR
jgi:plasmid stability protein